MSHHFPIRRRGLWAACVLSVALVGLLLPSRLLAEKPLRETTSLAFVPADVSFYAASLRNREKLEAVMGSKAFAAIMDMPLVKMGIAQVMSGLKGGPDAKDIEGDEDIDDDKEFEEDGAAGNPLDLIKPLMQDPKLLAMLMEMASEEMFIYGDQEYGNLLNLYQQVAAEINAAQYEMLFSGQIEPTDPAELFLPSLRLLNKNIDKLKVPTTVIGFRIKNTDNAAAQLAKLEELIKAAAAEQPMLEKAFKREKIGDEEFLVLRGDGSMIPWDEIPFADIEETEGEFDAIVAKLKKLTVAISLGVQGNYVLLSIAPGTDHLLTLGKGKLLIDRPEMAPVLKASDKRISSIGYLSDHYIKSAGGGMQSIDAILNGAMRGLSRNIDIDGDLKKGLEADLKLLSADIKSFIPEAAGLTTYSFMTDRGVEGYIHNRGDGSKPLDILNHLGGRPLAFVAGRKKYSTRGYDTMIKWIKKGKFYFEEIVIDELDDTQAAEYKKFKETWWPLLERAHLATRNKLMPSLKDGQMALVLDGKLKAKQWASEMPPAKTPLALPLVGVVLGVSDVPLLKKALGDYVAVAKETIELARELSDGEIPDFEFPELQKREFSATSGKFEVYYYKIPKFPIGGGSDEDGNEVVKYATLHKWLAPNVGLSSNFAALSLAPLHTKWLLEDRPLAIDGGPLSQRDKPLVSAAYFNWAGMVDMIVPWIDYGMDQAQKQQAANLAEFGVEPDADQAAAAAAQQKMIRSQIHQAANILKCFREYSSVTYKDAAGKNVTHYEWHFQDLP